MRIEPSNPAPRDNLTTEIKRFWSQNVNAERIFGKTVSQHQRGEDGYFRDLETQRYRSHRHLLPWIHGMQAGKQVLEVGCGIGLDAYAMASHGLNVTAVDLTEVGVRTAQTRFLRHGVNGRFLTASAEHLPFPSNTFDYVYSFGVLHHAADTEACIREVHRVLRPGGEARIMLYHRHSLNELVHRLTRIPFEEKSAICPVVRRFTKREIARLFRDFSSACTELDYVYGEGYGVIFRLTPRGLYSWMSRRFGWHIMCYGVK